MFMEFRQEMKVAFKMSDLGLLNYFFGIEVKQKDGCVFITQKKGMPKKY